ncbi:hypothetical protein NQ315_007605 [Exocentrus adspersus]|uniref:Nose resistant-to-fluoxetine protein N-terminal domain-containing protein n=1 Tax=Exocentrus adspersus TaxID=1586481 RepID=A0AAV8W854_9CUCU|nr:hypothetical protein NQ315_007605 [Exocentrus adspersus]
MFSLKLNTKIWTKLLLIELIWTIVNADSTSHQKIVNHGFLRMPTDLRAICKNLHNAKNVTNDCARHLDVVCGNFTLFMTMFSASAKFPETGFGYSTEVFIGHFDQCLSIDYSYKDGRVLGEYCTFGLLIPDVTKKILEPKSSFVMAVCKPSGCSAGDYNAIVNDLVNPRIPQLFIDDMCQTVESNSTVTLTTGFTITSLIFILVATFMIASTVYDAFLSQRYYKTSRRALFTAFSIISNSKKLFTVSRAPSKDNIVIFYGIRAISMMWIVAGHAAIEFRNVSVLNREATLKWMQSTYTAYLISALYAVDTFFFMSGFLLAFHFLQKQQGLPLVKQLKSNYYNHEDLCLTHTWYLSADMQMFLLSPLILIPLSRTLNKPSGYMVSMVGLLITNALCTFVPLIIKLNFDNEFNYYETHTRFIDYVIGITMAVFIRKNMDKPFLHWVKNYSKANINVIIWMITLPIMIAVLIGYQTVQKDQVEKDSQVFTSITRPIWCSGLCWIVYSCYHGYGGFVNSILSWPTFQVLGRLTYCIYLLHRLVEMYYASTTRIAWRVNDYFAFYMFCGHYAVSVLIAIVWSLAFEAPVKSLEVYFNGVRRGTGKRDSITDVKDVVSMSPKNEDTRDFTVKGADREWPHKRFSDVV